MKQSSIEWIYNNLKSHFEHDGDLLEAVKMSFEQAKAMHKEFQDAVNGAKWKYAMWVMDNELRALTKYAPDSMPDMEHETYEKIRNTLHRILNENELHL
jgi:hypothetical protein